MVMGLIVQAPTEVKVKPPQPRDRIYVPHPCRNVEGLNQLTKQPFKLPDLVGRAGSCGLFCCWEEEWTAVLPLCGRPIGRKQRVAGKREKERKVCRKGEGWFSTFSLYQVSVKYWPKRTILLLENATTVRFFHFVSGGGKADLYLCYFIWGLWLMGHPMTELFPCYWDQNVYICLSSGADLKVLWLTLTFHVYRDASVKSLAV